MPNLVVPVTRDEKYERSVRVWKSHCAAIDQGDAAAEWIRSYLGEAANGFRLVRMKDGFKREVNAKYAPGYQTGCFLNFLISYIISLFKSVIC